MSWTEPERCALCGNVDKRDLRFGLVHWRDAEPGMAYEHQPVCIDREKCRRRVEDQGDVWPLVEKAS